ncbi:MAG: protein prkA, partial [Candidatus Caldatribacteriota bacterium]
EKNMDISDLVGSVDLSKIKIYGTESHPLCWKFDGELDIANRGIIEFIEGLKVPDEFLYCLLWLAQERQIKTSRFPLTYADEVIIMHTNETEYKRFMNDKKNEALQNRTIAIKVPYNLKLSEEVRIYDKLLKQGHLGDIHIAPHALEVASLLAIASRLGKSEKLPLIKKIRLYNGESIEGYTEKEVKEIKEEFKDEGMFGISPRQIINSIAEAIAKTNKKCVSPIDVLRSIRDNFDKHIETQKMDKQYLDSLVFTVREEYDDIIKKEIQKVYIYAFEEQADALFRKYLDHIEAFVNKQKIIDPITEEEKDPDENFMRSIEEQIGVSTSSKSQFREDILIKLSSAAKRGETFRYNSHPRLKEAIEKKLFSDVKDTLRLTVSAILPDQEQKKKLDDLTNRLIQDHGYCKSCATEAIKYVSELLNK